MKSLKQVFESTEIVAISVVSEHPKEVNSSIQSRWKAVSRDVSFKQSRVTVITTYAKVNNHIWWHFELCQWLMLGKTSSSFVIWSSVFRFANCHSMPSRAKVSFDVTSPEDRNGFRTPLFDLEESHHRSCWSWWTRATGSIIIRLDSIGSSQDYRRSCNILNMACSTPLCSTGISNVSSGRLAEGSFCSRNKCLITVSSTWHKAGFPWSAVPVHFGIVVDMRARVYIRIRRVNLYLLFATQTVIHGILRVLVIMPCEWGAGSHACLA